MTAAVATNTPPPPLTSGGACSYTSPEVIGALQGLVNPLFQLEFEHSGNKDKHFGLRIAERRDKTRRQSVVKRSDWLAETWDLKPVFSE